MRDRSSRSVSLLAAATVAATCLGAVSGCGGRQANGATGQDPGSGTETLAHRARQVAAAWDGSEAAAAWRAGYHPTGGVVQPPRGGLRSKADEQAYRNRSFVLHGTLPATWPETGQVAWAGDASLTRPMAGPEQSYETLSVVKAADEKPSLTVTGAKLGEMRVPTNRGPAVVPAWLFTLDGYDSPLRRAAAVPSKVPPPPIKRAHEVPDSPINRLVRISADGRSVTVDALHGACDNGAAVHVLETPGSVVLSNTVKDRKHTGFCTKQGVLQQVTVKLSRPVGDRILLDALTGRPLTYKPLLRPGGSA